MNISEVMTTQVLVVSPEDTLQHAAQLMDEEDFGVLPICENDRLIGMLTDRDITVRAASKERSLSETKVREIMTPEAKYLFEDQSTEYAASYMNEYQIRRLPVLNRENRLVGNCFFG